jgi:energy-coupling factor transporter ATP-binding protein EcfA2/uncharacterized membrane protein
MACFEIRNLSFSYPGHTEKALDNVSFTLADGEFISLVGSSGCGKSTLLRQLKTVLAPHGARSGEILFHGQPLDGVDRREQTARIGFVMQDPDSQIVTDKVWHELAFGLESLGCDTPTIRRRVAEMASFFGIQAWFHRSVAELSGGQKQLLNLASIMAMQPSVLILDEPTSQLDPIAAADFLATVGKINRELGVSVLLTEHRLEEVFPRCDRVLVMDSGRILCGGTPAQVGEQLRELDHDMFLAMPTPMRVYAAVQGPAPCPVTVRDGRDWLSRLAERTPLGPVPPERPFAAHEKGEIPAVALDEVWFRYEKHMPDVVRGLSMEVYAGEFLAVLGGNGTGKTTTLSLISGLNRPYRGTVKLFGTAWDKLESPYTGLLGVLPQNPAALFSKKTVEEELQDMLSVRELSQEERDSRVWEMAALCRLEGLLQRHPYDLSGGEQQRAALAKVLLLRPRILLLDEPTKGLDSRFKAELAAILEALLAAGVAVVMVSHDVEFCARYAHRCAMFFDGSIAAEGTPRTFFSGNSFYTTAANRMARHLLPEAVTVNDVIAACGDTPPQEPEPRGPGGERPAYRLEERCEQPQPSRENRSRKLTKRTLLALAIIVLAMPLTIFLGMYYLEDRKYYVISILLLIETMIPFFMVFESRRPQARELIVIAVLCAIAVAGRSAFFMLPQFKPVLALVIIAGVAFGGETGFLVGAMTGFVSNFFFGQGPWTPWQMLCFGIVGFLAGVLFRKGVLGRDRLSLCVYGGFSALVIYGGLMNPASVIMVQTNVTKEMLIAAYIAGFPMDLLHAAATMAFLFLLSRPFLEKLDRIKLKYGLIE